MIYDQNCQFGSKSKVSRYVQEIELKETRISVTR